MKDLDKCLWELGVPTRTKHNEVAPAQHESAPIFESANLATDHNQLTMELMQKVAKKHGMACLLHEKPFAGVNGSGKHDNWAISTESGQNLLDPGNSPLENAQFLTFLAAIIKAVDENADLLRLAVATAGNDHRLGANEAPPAIISIFLGEELTEVIEALVAGHGVQDKHTQFDIGISSLPKFPKDTTDRNRTSPFAFTGNKFEFRSVGSTLNISGPNIVINSIVAEALCQFADRLEKADDFNEALKKLLIETFTEHKRIIFNGNGYDAKWLEEAQRRGLPNYVSSVDAIPHFTDKKNVDLFVKHKVFTEIEVNSRTEIMLENYQKTLNIESLTTIDMAKRQIIPAVMKYEKILCDIIISKKNAGLDASAETAIAKKVSDLTESLVSNTKTLEDSLLKTSEYKEMNALARYYHDVVFADMQSTRAVADELETLVAADCWPIPTYADILFSIK